ncbi:MAG: 8-amino-7-oxononanoate synthase [Nitrospirae bacterium]|nr:MAG: 8-amino-7-oxononanoate synthase [Nitrospirota bacterium]
MLRFSKALEELKEKALFRQIKDRESPQGAEITLKGKRLINFSSNDYLCLASDPRVVEASCRGLKEFGAGAGASRLLSGGTTLHERLELLLARFKSTERAILFNSGYSANTGIIQALADRDTAIFSDELNHASIIDGCRLSRGTVYVYRHKDLEHLRELIKKSSASNKLIVTDTVFSMDGDIAPLKELLLIATEYDALLYIDDAHGTGVLGKGYGALKHFGIKAEQRIIQMSTLSKAVGSFGAFFAGSEDIAQWLINRSRSLIFSTALPPSVIAASLEGVRIIMAEPERVERLWNNRETLLKGLKELNIETSPSETPIIPVKVKTNQEALRLSSFLFERGIYAPAIRKPTVSTPRIRLTLLYCHSDEHISRLIDALREARKCGLL